MEPLTLAAVGGAILTGGVQFLYSQVGELLRRRWEARRAAAETAEADRRVAELPGDYFAGDLAGTVVAEERLAAAEQELAAAWERTTRYATGARLVDPADREALIRIDGLRVALEKVLGRPITFRGEERRRPGVYVERKIGTVAGEDIGAAVRELGDGDVVVRDSIDRVERGGRSTGVWIDTMGGGPTGSGR